MNIAFYWCCIRKDTFENNTCVMWPYKLDYSSYYTLNDISVYEIVLPYHICRQKDRVFFLSWIFNEHMMDTLSFVQFVKPRSLCISSHLITYSNDERSVFFFSKNNEIFDEVKLSLILITSPCYSFYLANGS